MDNYSDEFQRIKILKEKRRLDFSSKNEEEYNLPFSVTELRQSLQKANDSATGLDQVHCQLLTHLQKFGSIRPFKSLYPRVGIWLFSAIVA